MTVKERVLTIKLIEKMKKDPEYAKQLGVIVVLDSEKEEVTNGAFKKSVFKNCK